MEEGTALIEQPPPARAALLAVEGVTIKFGEFVAVRNVSFSLQPGHLLGLIGPNGAGKTTLLRAIASLQAMNSGAIFALDEAVLPGREETARMIGFTPDVPPAYENLTVRQFLEFIAAGYGITAESTEPAIDFWLEKVWLTDKAKLKIKGLSRGMRQRLGIARTLMPNPTIILLDEPASGLDPAGRAQFRKLLTDLRDQGKTLIVSSHILSDMEDYCTHIAIMSKGRMVQFGTVRQIAAGVDDGRRGYTIELAHPVADLEAQLASIPGVGNVKNDRIRVTFDFLADKNRAAELLAEMVRRQWPIASFTPNNAGLEEAYLRTGIRQVD